MHFSNFSNSSGIIRQHSSLVTWVQQILDVIIALSILYVLSIQKFGNFTSHYVVLSVLTAALMILVYQWSGIYFRLRTGSIYAEAQTLFGAWITVTILQIVLAFITKTSEIFSREVAILWFLSGYLAQLAFHGAARIFLKYVRIKGRNLRIGLLVGEGNLAREFAHRVKSTPWLGIELKGYVEERKIKGPKNKKNKSELQLLGDIDSMNRIIKENNIDIIYITLPIQKTHKIEDIMRKLSRFSVDIHWVPDITSFQLINHGMREIAGLPIICLSDSPFSGMNFYLKWLEDKILAIIILILISPLLLSISILIKLTSEGPVIFKQVRDGLNGEKITVWKFRTMSVHKEPEGIQAQATKNDPRVTALGAILRRTSLDEIPQFFNVIAGSMSIVGPRPHPIFLNDAFKDKIETYMLRHRIKPGITGWAQVNGWRGETDTFEKMEMRVKYDLYYINNWSLWLDLKIILMSIFKGFTGANAY